MEAFRFPKQKVFITQPWLEISLLIMKFGTFKYSDLLRTSALLKWNRKLIRDVIGCRVENWDNIITTPPMILPFNIKFGMPTQTDMPVTTAGQNRNRKYNLNIRRPFAFPKPEVVIAMPWTEISLWYLVHSKMLWMSGETGTNKLETRSWYSTVAG